MFTMAPGSLNSIRGSGGIVFLLKQREPHPAWDPLLCAWPSAPGSPKKHMTMYPLGITSVEDPESH